MLQHKRVSNKGLVFYAVQIIKIGDILTALHLLAQWQKQKDTFDFLQRGIDEKFGGMFF